MKAVRFHEHGGPEVLRFEEVPEPQPGPGQVRIRVRYASVNHLDIWLRRGLPGMRIPLPHIPGADASGVVDALGDGVNEPKPGTRVLLDPGLSCRLCEFCTSGNQSMCARYSIFGEHQDGCYAQWIVAPAENAIPVPEGVTDEAAAAAPLTYLTAWNMLIHRGRLRAGETVVILAAGAGVGVACVQIAKRAGAFVIATAGSDEKCAKARELGADVVINHSEADFAQEVRRRTGKRGADVVVDYIGKQTWQKSLQALRRGGRLLTCGATTGHDPVEDLRHIFYRQIEVIGSTMGSRAQLLEVLNLVFRGELRPVVDSILPLSEAAEAHRRIEARRVFGKVLLQAS
jgi:NADPH:quinone reductase-like Zn-dependent oxidoreductase